MNKYLKRTIMTVLAVVIIPFVMLWIIYDEIWARGKLDDFSIFEPKE